MKERIHMEETTSGVISADAGQSTGEVTSPAAGDGASEGKTYTAQDVEGIVTKRLKTTKARLSAYEDLGRKLAGRYGVDVNDLQAISDAVESDRAWLREQADENGVTEDIQLQLNELQSRRAADDFATLKAKMGESVRETESIYPDFDLTTEMHNPKFMQFIGSGLSVRDAYEIIHKDEIIGGAMQYTAQQVREQTVNDIRARGMRPSENGTSSQAAASAHIDVNKLTPAQMDDLEARARRGERITFG